MRFFSVVASIAQEAKKDNPEIKGLRGQLEEAKNKLGYASTEYKRVRDALAQAQADHSRWLRTSRLPLAMTKP